MHTRGAHRRGFPATRREYWGKGEVFWAELHDVRQGGGDRRGGDQARELGAQLVSRDDADEAVVQVAAVGDDAILVGADHRSDPHDLDLAIRPDHGQILVPVHANQVEATVTLALGGDDHDAGVDRDAGELDDVAIELAGLDPVGLGDLVVEVVAQVLAGEPEHDVTAALGLHQQVLAEDTLADRLVGDRGQRPEVGAVACVGLARGLGVVRGGENQRVGVGMAVEQTALKDEAELLHEPVDQEAEVVVEDLAVEAGDADLVVQIPEEAQPGHLDGHAAVVAGGSVDLIEDGLGDQGLG